MGQHKYNPTAIAAKEGTLPPKVPEWMEDELFKAMPPEMMVDAADAIEDLNRQRDRAYARLCEWCGVCPEDKRNAEGCEIAALNPKPPKEGDMST